MLVGLGKAYVNDDPTDEEISSTTLMLQAGYQYNKYLALEGRYTFGLGGSDYDSGNLTSIGFDYRVQLDDVDADTWTVSLSYNF